jgi:hypothetical protein
MCKHIAAALYGVGARLDEDPALFFTLRGINIDDLITQTLTDTAHTLLGKVERQSQHILQDVDLGDVFGIQLDDVAVSSPHVPAVQPTTSTAQKPIGTARKTTASTQITPATRKTATTPRVMPPPPVAGARTTARGSVRTTRTVTKPTGPGASRPPYGTMLETLVKAVGIARKGKSIDQLQAKLGWTRVQVHNTVRRADAKGLIEAVATDVYRRKV